MGARVAFVLPTYEHFGYARKAAKTFVEHTPGPVEIYLIDDASKAWASQDWKDWPKDVMHFHRFQKNGGLTRSWNYGLRLARERGVEFTCCGNSDILFTPGWFDGILQVINLGAHLVGPLTNAPGHRRKQQVKSVIKNYKLTDDPSYLAKIARRLREEVGLSAYRQAGVNGFCMVARTAAWWGGAHDSQYVFNPKFKMTGNEDELQRRWSQKGRTIAISLSSFVFHYRGVSRKGGTRGKQGEGWYRLKKT